MADTNVIILTADAAREKQENSQSGSSDDVKVTAEFILSQVNKMVEVNASANRNYADLTWASMKSGRYTDIILSWIKLTNKATEAQHKIGLANTQWATSVAQPLTAAGYSWCFMYYRDQEQPFGFRVSWWKEEDGNTNPIDEAWEEYPWRLLPVNRYVFPLANELTTEVVTTNTQSVNQSLIQNVFSILSENIQSSAKEGYDNVIIPWNLLGDSYTIQKLFIAENPGAIKPNHESTSWDLHKIFKYGNYNDDYPGYFASVTNRTFSKEDFDPVDMGFFNNASWQEESFTTFDTTNFSLYHIITNILGYNMNYYADIDWNSGKTYCGGLIIGWNEQDVNTIAREQYFEHKEAFNKSMVAVYTWANGSVPQFDDYIAANRTNNSNYLKALIDLVSSKMTAAFQKGDRTIAIAWSDISSSYKDTVKAVWRNNYAQYIGQFDSPVSNGNSFVSIEDNIYTSSLENAFCYLLRACDFSSFTNNHNYTYAYYRYKSSTTPSTSNGIYNIDWRDSFGIVITLVGKLESDLNNSAQAQAASAIKKVQDEYLAKEAPKN